MAFIAKFLQRLLKSKHCAKQSKLKKEKTGSVRTKVDCSESYASTSSTPGFSHFETRASSYEQR